jgi:hypothetical protein
MARPTHPNKEIEAAVGHAEHLGWTVWMAKGHAWGRLYCAHHDRDGCMISVWSTPKNTGNHAKDILRKIGKCAHGSTAENGKDNDDAHP